MRVCKAWMFMNACVQGMHMQHPCMTMHACAWTWRWEVSILHLPYCFPYYWSWILTIQLGCPGTPSTLLLQCSAYICMLLHLACFHAFWGDQIRSNTCTQSIPPTEASLQSLYTWIFILYGRFFLCNVNPDLHQRGKNTSTILDKLKQVFIKTLYTD